MTIDPVVIEMVEFFQKINEEIPEKTRAAMDNIRKLDEAVAMKMAVVQKIKVDFMANYDSLTTEDRSKAFNLLQEHMEKIADICNAKVDIARVIRVELAEMHEKFKIQKDKFIENCPPENGRTTPKAPKKENGNDVDSPGSGPESGEKTEKIRRGRKRKVDEKVKKEKGGEEGNENLEAESEDEEPKTYCWCQLAIQEKSDEMVCCENPDCPFEWFHFSCIGMISAPLGDWYCLECRSEENVKKEENGDSTEKKAKRGPKKRKIQ